MDPLAVVRHLSEDIGIRFCGTAAEHRAAQYLAQEMARRGLAVETQPFGIMGWELHSEPVIDFLTPQRLRATAYPMIYSLSTPPAGIEGALEYAGKCVILGSLLWDKYNLVDELGQVAAWVIVREVGEASAMPNTDDAAAMPMVVIGKAEGEALRAWLASGEQVRARLQVSAEFNPGARSHNVIGTQPGSHPEEGFVVVCGHYDTEYNSPGAIDNASGIAGMLELIERMKDASPRREIRYIAFGAEEIMMAGSGWYVRRLKDAGTLRGCVAVICLDMIACNDPTWIWATDGELRIKDKTARVANTLGISQKYGPIEWVVPPWGTSDHYPFQLEGVGVLCCTWHGDTWAHTHLPSDSIEQFNLDVYRDTLELCEPVLRDLARAF